MKFADDRDPAKGITFDGHVFEDFKLMSGTWVHMGAARVKLIAACDPLVQDAVITGHDREKTGALCSLTLRRSRRSVWTQPACVRRCRRQAWKGCNQALNS